jgi:hypothetical protein
VSFSRFHKGSKVSGSRYKTTVTRESSKEVFYMSRLTISSVEAGDEGEYKAVAKNAHGEANAIVNLSFEGGGKFKYDRLYCL